MTFKEIIFLIYVSVACILIARLILQMVLLGIQYAKSIKVIQKEYTLLYKHRYKTTFSFFRWVFIQPVVLSDDDLDQIIAHEKIHVIQYHSIDLLLIELLSAVLWFNPLVWLMRKSMKLVHEYLADRGVLESGIDKIRYQAVLVNQVAEERLVCLSSSFNHSIKKRIMMMTKTNIQGRSVYRLIAAVPVAIILFTAMAVFNGMFSEAKASVNAGIFTNPAIGFTPAQDTVVKKTVVKHIHKEHPQDTIVHVTEEILTGADAEKEKQKIKHEGKGDSEVVVHIENDGSQPDHKTEKHIVKYTVKHSDGEAQDDSIKSVTIIRHTGSDDAKTETFTVRHSGNVPHESNILYIVDGVEQHDSNVIERMDPNDIVRIDVIKNDQIGKYTTKDVDGVIVITTKKGKK